MLLVWISSSGKGKIRKKMIMKEFESSVTVSVRDEDITLYFSTPVIAETSLTLTCPNSVVSTIDWMKSQNKNMEVKELFTYLQSVFDLKNVCLEITYQTKRFPPEILSLIQASASLTEISVIFRYPFVMEIMSLEESLKQMGWTLTLWGESILIQTDRDTFTVKELKMKREKSESRSVRAHILSSPSKQSSSKDAETFTPELLQRDDDKHKKTYRFVSPHAGQFRCSLTNIVFVMAGEGEVLYKTVSWDPRQLDGLGRMQPAGPFYSIDRSRRNSIELTGSISQLHLPHCEIFSEEIKKDLAVAHLTAGNTEIMDPLDVTETHVVIAVRDLSTFGIIRRFLSSSPYLCPSARLSATNYCGTKRKHTGCPFAPV